MVDRKDLDYQTIREYDSFQKGAANSNTSTKILKKQLEDSDAKIIITTIQKLDRFIVGNKGHEVFKKHMVIIFDECHRSQFGEMHQKIIRAFKKYHLFGFTGTPIFPKNAPAKLGISTTAQAFGRQLHTYTIVDAINDGNVLPFRIDYVNTVKMKEEVEDWDVSAIDRERALASPRRIEKVVEYILGHFDQKTKRNHYYTVKERRLAGFNSIFAVSSIPLAMKYYSEFKRQQALTGQELKVAIIYSFSPNEDLEDPTGLMPDEELETDALDQTSREFLESAIADYNAHFNVNYDTTSDKFENYYKDLSQKVKDREVDILIVVNMFLTGFDAKTLNTLWVDKNLRQHGLIQAFSRTNRILNSVKTFGNIVCFRDLSRRTDEAIALFGDPDAGGIVLLKDYDSYYYGYEDEKGQWQKGYSQMIDELKQDYPLGEQIVGEQKQKDFIKLFGGVLRSVNILSAFDKFEGNEILSEREEQDYRSVYIDTYEDLKRSRKEAEKEAIEDDLVFEMELVRQVEVNIDYILMLVAKYHQSNCQDKEILVSIGKAVDSSLQLRSKKELIQRFVEGVNASTEVEGDWRRFVAQQKEEDLEEIMQAENLKEDLTRSYVENAFRNGELKTSGTEFDRILPPMSRFGGGNREQRKQGIIEKLLEFFEKYFGLI